MLLNKLVISPGVIGYFSLNELQSARGSMGLLVERDLYFQPTPLSQLRRQKSKISGYINSDDDFMITYDFTDADREDPTDFLNFMARLLGDD